MHRRTSIARVITGFAALAGATIASSQDLGALKGAAGGMDVSSLASGSAGNAAGVIEYCMKNNFLGGDASGVLIDSESATAGRLDHANQELAAAASHIEHAIASR